MRDSKVDCLLGHRGGNFYASVKVARKLVRRSIETEDYNVAKNRLDPVLEEIRGAKNACAAGTLGPAIQAEVDRVDLLVFVSWGKWKAATKRMSSWRPVSVN